MAAIERVFAVLTAGVAVIYLIVNLVAMFNRTRKNKGQWLPILILLGLPTLSDAACSGSGLTWTCTAGSTPANVQSAVNSATVGATISLESGAYSWSSGVTATKSLTIQGAGSGSTVITFTGASGSDAFDFTPSNNTDILRITGIGFELGSMNNGRRAITINGRPDTAFIPTQVRIDNNAITGGGGNPGAIVTFNQVYGVIDHNTFTNSYSAIFGWGAFDQNTIWEDAKTAGDIFAGTANAMFVEDNTFTYTGNGITADASIYIQQGSVFVVRYNMFDGSAVTNPNVFQLMYNHHGNQEYCEGTTCTTYRGQTLFESYNNTAICSPGNCEFLSMRGGSNIFHDETYSVQGGGGNGYAFKFSEEECWQTAFFSPLRTTWPAQDQIFNTFIWNSTLNGSAVTNAEVDTTGDGACGADFIQLDRDYFLHAPQSTGGRETFTGARFGGSTTSPTTGDGGSMSFSSSGVNAYYPYTPYTYPHPLVGTGSPPSIVIFLEWAASMVVVGWHFRAMLLSMVLAGASIAVNVGHYITQKSYTTSVWVAEKYLESRNK
jgi:hypothetical protein